VSIFVGLIVMVGSVYLGTLAVKHVDDITGDFIGGMPLWLGTLRLLAFPFIIALCLMAFFMGLSLIFGALA
jgi:hypothetical protein